MSQENKDGKQPPKEQKPKTALQFASRMRLYLLLILALVLAMVINEVMSGRDAMFKGVPGNTSSAVPATPGKSYEPASIGPKFFQIVLDGTDLKVQNRKVELDECVRLAVASGLPIYLVVMPSAMTSAEDSLNSALKAVGLGVDIKVTPNFDPETGKITSYNAVKVTPPAPIPMPEKSPEATPQEGGAK